MGAADGEEAAPLPEGGVVKDPPTKVGVTEAHATVVNEGAMVSEGVGADEGDTEKNDVGDLEGAGDPEEAPLGERGDDGEAFPVSLREEEAQTETPEENVGDAEPLCDVLPTPPLPVGGADGLLATLRVFAPEVGALMEGCAENEAQALPDAL